MAENKINSVIRTTIEVDRGSVAGLQRAIQQGLEGSGSGAVGGTRITSSGLMAAGPARSGASGVRETFVGGSVGEVVSRMEARNAERVQAERMRAASRLEALSRGIPAQHVGPSGLALPRQFTPSIQPSPQFILGPTGPIRPPEIDVQAERYAKRYQRRLEQAWGAAGDFPDLGLRERGALASAAISPGRRALEDIPAARVREQERIASVRRAERQRQQDWETIFGRGASEIQRGVRGADRGVQGEFRFDPSGNRFTLPPSLETPPPFLRTPRFAGMPSPWDAAAPVSRATLNAQRLEAFNRAQVASAQTGIPTQDLRTVPISRGGGGGAPPGGAERPLNRFERWSGRGPATLTGAIAGGAGALGSAMLLRSAVEMYEFAEESIVNQAARLQRDVGGRTLTYTATRRGGPLGLVGDMVPDLPAELRAARPITSFDQLQGTQANILRRREAEQAEDYALRTSQIGRQQGQLDVSRDRQREDSFKRVRRLDLDVEERRADIRRQTAANDLQLERRREDIQTQRERREIRFQDQLKDFERGREEIREQGRQRELHLQDQLYDFTRQRTEIDIATGQRKLQFEDTINDIIKDRRRSEEDYERDRARRVEDLERFDLNEAEALERGRTQRQRSQQDLGLSRAMGALGLVQSLQSGNLMGILGAIQNLRNLRRQREDLARTDEYGRTAAEARNAAASRGGLVEGIEDLDRGIQRRREDSAEVERRTRRANEWAAEAEQRNRDVIQIQEDRVRRENRWAAEREARERAVVDQQEERARREDEFAQKDEGRATTRAEQDYNVAAERIAVQTAAINRSYDEAIADIITENTRFLQDYKRQTIELEIAQSELNIAREREKKAMEDTKLEMVNMANDRQKDFQIQLKQAEAARNMGIAFNILFAGFAMKDLFTLVGYLGKVPGLIRSAMTGGTAAATTAAESAIIKGAGEGAKAAASRIPAAAGTAAKVAGRAVLPVAVGATAIELANDARGMAAMTRAMAFAFEYRGTPLGDRIANYEAAARNTSGGTENYERLIDEMINTPNIHEYLKTRGYARGGIISRRTGLVDMRTGKLYGQMAEAGPEAIVPLNGSGGGGVGGAIVMNFYLSGDVSDDTIQKIIDESHRQYNRRILEAAKRRGSRVA